MRALAAASAAFVSGLSFGCAWGFWRMSKLHAQHALHWKGSADLYETLALRATHLGDQIEALLSDGA